MNKLLLALPLLLLFGKKGPGHQGSGVRTISMVLSDPKIEVKIYIPSRLISSRGAASELVIFLHGHNPRAQTLTEITDRHNLEAQISRMSQRGRRQNSIWVAPFSLGKEDAFNAIFSSAEKTQTFIDSVLQVVSKQGVKVNGNLPLVLSGQSGARTPILKILNLQVFKDRIREVYLFDALYGADAAFAQFALRPDTRFWTAYGVSTAKNAQTLYKMIASKTNKALYSDLALGGQGMPAIKKAAPKPADYLAGKSFSQSFGLTEQEQKKPIGFLSSPVEHKFTARNWLAALMT